MFFIFRKNDQPRQLRFFAFGSVWVLLLGLLGPGFSQAQAQHRLAGQVLDAGTGQGLPFATVLYDIRARKGVTTDINGYFDFSTSDKKTFIMVSYLGYKKQRVQLDTVSNRRQIRVVLSRDEFSLGEVEITTERNPGEKIMRRVVANRKRNDPERLASYECETYNKVIFDYLLDNFSLPDALVTKADSQNYAMFRHAQQAALFVMESVTERKYVFPENVAETVIANRISGLQEARLAALATDFQPFTFYREVIPFLDKSFINPVSPACWNRYDFHLKDTLFQGQDTVYILSFAPKKGKNFQALKGVLHINTFHYAVQSVVAEPAYPTTVVLRLEQLYQCIDRSQWFPSQLNFELRMPNYPTKDIGMKISGRSYIRSTKLNTGLRQKDLGYQEVHMLDDAPMKADSFWVEEREIALNQRERNTYQLMDSLGKKSKLDFIMRQLEKLSWARIGLGPIDINLEKTFFSNPTEGFRIGTGFFTSPKLSEHFELGGFFGYGTKDRQWKYGAQFSIWRDRLQDQGIGVRYTKDLVFPGSNTLNSAVGIGATGLTNPLSYVFEGMDWVEEKEVWGEFRLFRFVKLRPSLHQIIRQPTYNYRFRSTAQEAPDSVFRSTEAHIGLRFAYGERLVESLGQNSIQGSRFPVLNMVYSRGWDDWLGGEYDYHRLELNLSHTYHTHRWGYTEWQLRMGWASQGLPAGLLFFGEGSSNGKQWGFWVPFTFQTMNPTSFLSDRYASFFFQQDIGSRLLRTPKFQPRITMVHGMAFGDIRQPEQHIGLDFSSLKKGYYESGLRIQQILRIRLAGIAYIGLGAGAFYKYGPYASGDWQQNIAYKLAINLASF
ncbi:MAG: DUF5686 family protein [Bacteroidota bacterium]